MDSQECEIGKWPKPPKKYGPFPPISWEELLEVLGLTIREDEVNKVITFLCQLSAYTDSSQFNLSFNAPSSAGKSYIPIEISALFPEEDVKTVGYCSPTAFFHDAEVDDKGKIIVDLSRKILIFLDQPHTLLLQHLRPLLSHDKKEISIKITDKAKVVGMRTKNITIKGFPAVIFCTAGLRVEEQEATRFLLLSPDVTQEKIRGAINVKLMKESDIRAYCAALETNPKREELKTRILGIRAEHIGQIMIPNPEKIQEAFCKDGRLLRLRDARDIGRVFSFVKVFALLNLWDRQREGSIIIANEEDVEQALTLWHSISESQVLNLPPYVYNLYLNIILPLSNNGNRPVSRQEITTMHYEIYERPLPDWQLRREILPMLEMAGLIRQETDINDKRRTLVFVVNSKK